MFLQLGNFYGKGEHHSFLHPKQATFLYYYIDVLYMLQDSTGNGIGDLQGIISKLSHFEYLGIETIWLSPIFPSPMKDHGYDVSDYVDIEPLFGSLDVSIY